MSLPPFTAELVALFTIGCVHGLSSLPGFLWSVASPAPVVGPDG